MSDDSEIPPRLGTKGGIAYAESSTVPFIFFDGVACHGALNGVIEIELVGRIMAPTVNGGVHMSFVPVARLRCSPTAAAGLLDSIQKAIKMAEQSEQQPPAPASATLN